MRETRFADKLVGGEPAGSSPHIRWTGTPRRFPARSCSAALTAARADALNRIAFAIASSSASSDQPSASRSTGASTGSTLTTVSAVSP